MPTTSIGTRTATIPNAGTTSPAVSLNGATLVGIITPAALTGTALTFQASPTLTGTYSPVYATGGTQVSYTVGTSRYIVIPAQDMAGVQFVKVVSGSTEAAARDITLVVREVA